LFPVKTLRYLTLFILLLLLTATVTLADSLSNKDRMKIFDDVWQTINENYYDPTFNGVDWQAVRQRYRGRINTVSTDQDFYQLLDQMVGELHDVHTRFRTPSERQRRDSQLAISTGLLIYEIEGESVIVGLNPQSEAAQAGVKVGMRVQAICYRVNQVPSWF
jgi:carboxyl-terminal processing protease